MKKIKNILCGLGVLLMTLTACNKAPHLTTMETVSFSSALTASNNTVALTAKDSSTVVVTFEWPGVSYPIDAPVTYSLQITTPTDTIGATPWTNALTVAVGDATTSYGMTGSALNALAIQLGLAPDEPNTLVFRVMSSLDRPAFSSAASIEVTPYLEVSDYPSMWVPGDYQGWDPSSAPTIVSVQSDHVFEGYIYIPGDGSMEFKLTAQPAWEPMAYGDGGDGQLIEANFTGGNFKVPTEGYYLLSANLDNMTYTVLATTWSVLGDATPGGWDSDTQLEYDRQRHVWTATMDLVVGSFKFRANNAWNLDFGVNGEGKLTYANHPVLEYNPDTQNISVSESGNYTLILDLNTAGNYTYQLVKN